MFNPLQLLSQLSKVQNPQALMMSMFQGNPAMQRAIQMADGKNEEQLKEIVGNLSQQAGIDINQLTSMAKNMGFKL